jgi:hypothetical protein
MHWWNAPQSFEMEHKTRTHQISLKRVMRRKGEIEDEERNLLYIATDDGVYQSRDGGESWERFSEGFPYDHRNDSIKPAVYKLSLDPHAGDVYSRADFEIYRTGFDTPTWEPIGKGLPAVSITTDLFFSPLEGSIYIVNGCSGVIVFDGCKKNSMGVFARHKEEDKYAWVKEKLPIEIKDLEPVCTLNVDPNSGDLYASTYVGLFRKTQGQWELVLSEDFVLGVYFEKGYQQRAVAFTADKTMLRKAGKWVPVTNKPWSEHAWVKVACFHTRSLFISTNDGLFVTRDDGTSWQRIWLPDLTGRASSVDD